MPAGSINLGQMAEKLPETVTISCNRCDRRGLLRTPRLMAEYGPDMPVPDLRKILAADCPRMIAGAMHDPCGVHFPGLSG